MITAAHEGLMSLLSGVVAICLTARAMLVWGVFVGGGVVCMHALGCKPVAGLRVAGCESNAYLGLLLLLMSDHILGGVSLTCQRHTAVCTAVSVVSAVLPGSSNFKPGVSHHGRSLSLQIAAQPLCCTCSAVHSVYSLYSAADEFQAADCKGLC